MPRVDSASSAVRNLNDYEIMGRKLRVDFSNEQKSSDDDKDQVQTLTQILASSRSRANHDSQGSSSHNAHSNGAAAAMYNAQSSTLPPLPAGKELPPGVTCTDAISRTLNTLPPPQLLDILGQMKTLATSDPQRATELLQHAPQLAYAVFQALLLMGLVSPEAIQSVVDPNAAQPVQAAPPVGFPAAPVPGFPGAPPVANSTPPVASMPYAPPPAAAPQPYAAPAQAVQDPDALMRAVMELPQAQINMLPEAERQQILALRATFASQRR